MKKHYTKKTVKESETRAAARKAFLHCVRTTNGGNVLAVQAECQTPTGEVCEITITAVRANVISSKGAIRFCRETGRQTGRYRPTESYPYVIPCCMANSLRDFANAFPGGIWDSGWQRGARKINLAEFEAPESMEEVE